VHNIEMQEMSAEFLKIWHSAGNHLNSQVQGGIRAWLRAHPNPPILEHLSFRIENQLFFIRIEDRNEKIQGPGSIQGLLAVSEACQGHACLLPMRKKLFGGEWVSAFKGWGLLDARTMEPIDPMDLITDERIVMTAWEQQDLAVQVVKDSLQKQGSKIMSWQSNPEVDPAIWFLNSFGTPEWVVVRATNFPDNQAARPANWEELISQCSSVSNKGHFASVAIASADQPFLREEEPAIPLWRGRALHIRFNGLE